MDSEFTVTIKDSDGKTFTRGWKNTANKLDAIRWTVESVDVPYYLDVNKIVEVIIGRGE
jgi:hypothetical protein